MTPQEAAVILTFLYPQVVDESKTTRKVLAAVPADGCHYKPDERAKSGIELAAHIATAEKMFLEGILTGAFSRPNPASLPPLDTPEAVVAFYDSEVVPLQAKVAELPAEKLATPIPALGRELPGIVLLSFKIKHTVHHRGQLAAYLRAMGGRVPAIYGGSADEPMSVPTRQA